MRLVKRIKRFIGNLLYSDRAEHTLDAELRAYVEDLTDRNLANNMPREEARRQALVEMGGIEQVKEQVQRETIQRPHTVQQPSDGGVVAFVGIVALAAATVPA